jgi:hypothetical protein
VRMARDSRKQSGYQGRAHCQDTRRMAILEVPLG